MVMRLVKCCLLGLSLCATLFIYGCTATTAQRPADEHGNLGDRQSGVDESAANDLDGAVASKFDLMFGYGKYKKFIKWMHRQYGKGKAKGENWTKEDLEEGFQEWERQGRPGPDSKWEDVLDIIIPFPPLFDPCIFDPANPVCDPSMPIADAPEH